MKTKISMLVLVVVVSITTGLAQDRTTVSAQNSEISDNLDLRAVASIFGDSRDLEDFERRLNDPKVQISNLDLNQDNQVDYLRVIESIEGNAHLIVIQSVLGRDTFQDVATVEVERDQSNRVQVQVVGDVFMYGNNYIYEPVYAFTPIIYNSFWVGNYTPYFSSWNWGFYPSHFYYWSPFPVFRYHRNIGLSINNHHHYNYVNFRRCEIAYNSYRGRRGNAFENQYPNRSFNSRNQNFTNRYELDNSRNTRTSLGSRTQVESRNTRNNPNSSVSTRGNSNQRTTVQSGETRGNSNSSSSTRGNSNTRTVTQQNQTTNGTTRNNNQREVSNQSSSTRATSNSQTERPRNTENTRESNNSNNSSRSSNRR